MFQRAQPQNGFEATLRTLDLIYHQAVRTVRRSDRNFIIALARNALQAVTMFAVFYIFMSVLGLRASKIRGDFVIFLVSGIFLYMTHVKALASVAGAEPPTGGMMLHGPMNPLVAVGGAALAGLYMQLLSLGTLLLLVHVAWKPIEIDQPLGLICMLLLAWGSGVALGLVVYALKPWAPGLVATFLLIYRRINMIASGKMFVVNTLPASMVALFDWNPLFHIIDQARGYAFLNYTPHVTSLGYPVWVTLALFALGMIGQFYTSRHASASWGVGR